MRIIEKKKINEAEKEEFRIIANDKLSSNKAAAQVKAVLSKMDIDYEEEDLNPGEKLFTVKADSSDVQKLRGVSWKGGVFHESIKEAFVDYGRDASIPWVRKPGYDIRELKSRPLRKLPRGFDDLEIERFKTYRDFIDGKGFYDGIPQYFVAEIDKEGVSVLVNTEGYDYPRYAVLIPDDLLF
jgi:hypothetical protein